MKGRTPMQTVESRGETTLRPAAYTDQFVDAAGIRLHYQDYGTAGKPPMLCVHGGAAHAHWFDFVAPGFNADYHVRAIDLRGHGDSGWDKSATPDYSYQRYAADLNEAVQKLDLRDFVLIGHSMGGAVSLLYASTYPGRVKKLVVVDTTVRMNADRVAKLNEVGNREGSRYPSRDEFISRYRLRPAGTLATPAVISHLAQNSPRQAEDGTWRHKFDRNVYGKRELFDGIPHWSNIKVPALLVKGDRSDRISPEIHADIKARCPQVELVEVSNSDHHVTLDNPLEFVQKVKPFLAK